MCIENEFCCEVEGEVGFGEVVVFFVDFLFRLCVTTVNYGVSCCLVVSRHLRWGCQYYISVITFSRLKVLSCAKGRR